MSKQFGRCLRAYQNGWVTEEELHFWVSPEGITEDEFQQIISKEVVFIVNRNSEQSQSK